MAKLTFNIDNNVSKVFDFILDYTDTSKESLFSEWMKTPKDVDFKQKTTDTTSIELSVSDSDKIEFEGFCKWALKNASSDGWFEYCVRNYCSKQLSEVQEYLTISTSNRPTDIIMSRAKARNIAVTAGYPLNSCYTFASKNTGNKSLYWANPGFSFLNEAWSLILNDWENRILYIFNIPAGSFRASQFYPKSESLINLQLRVDDFTDCFAGADFKPYQKGEIKY